MNSPEVSPAPEESTPRDRGMSPLARARWLIATGLVGAALTAGGLLLFVVINNRGRLPVMSPQDFFSAQARWNANPLLDYDAHIVVLARSHEVYEVRVRGGQVVTATRNGVPIRQARSRATWSVPGMFGTISSDVEHLEQVARGEAEASTPQVQLRGVFDDQHGFPIRYHRTEQRKWSPNYEVSWEVHVAPVSGSAPNRDG